MSSNRCAELQLGEVQNPAEISHVTGENPDETGFSKETCVLEVKPIATLGDAEGIDNTENELVELHLPDEASTFKNILAEDNSVLGPDQGASDHRGHVHTPQIAVGAVLGTAANGIDYVKGIDYRQHAKSVLQWSAAHPYQTALQVGMGIMMLSPAAVAGPALSAAGFGSSGILPGASPSILWWSDILIRVSASFASAQHAAIGNVAARSFFATLQSAGAGGYGLPIVNGFIRAGSALGLIGSAVGKVTQPVDKDTGSADSAQELDEEGLSGETNSVGPRGGSGANIPTQKHFREVKAVKEPSFT